MVWVAWTDASRVWVQTCTCAGTQRSEKRSGIPGRSGVATMCSSPMVNHSQ